jgi:hypothetical protein
MPAISNTLDTKNLRHEEFCLPRPGADKPRVEGFLAYTDDPAGLSRPAMFVTRCLECGAATYRPIE